MQSIYLGRQPILDSDSKLCAYEILYKGSDVALSRYSSASIINNVLNKFGTQALLGHRRGFVQIDEKFLLHDIIFSIPNQFFVFTLLADIPMSERVVERVIQLQQKGYILSIDNLKLSQKSLEFYKPILKYCSYINLNIKESSRIKLREMIVEIKKYQLTVIATEVNNSSNYRVARELGCEWFVGYFFAKPKILENIKYEPSQMAVLRLYNLLMQDVNIDEITDEFEKNHEITVQLLQFINSGAFHFRSKISSIHHILTLVGRIPLGQWLMLMIYSKSVSKDEQTPLMLMVKNRTELMENILKVVKPDVRSNMLGEAYFVGVISLMDTLFGMRLEAILEQMNISDDVENALLKDTGILGEIYALIRDIEDFKPASVQEFELKYKLPSSSIEKVVIQSMKDVNIFENPELLC